MYLGHVYIIASYESLYDVLTYPCHDKIYMQLTRSLQVLAWRWVERHFPTIFTHQGFKMSYVSEETFRKNWCRVVCQTFKLSTERDIATIRPMDLGPKFSWSFVSFISLISLLFTLFPVMIFYCSVYKHKLVISRYLGHGWLYTIYLF